MQINIQKLNMHSSWIDVLKDEFAQEYFVNIKKEFIKSKQNKETIFPPSSLIFNAFNLTPIENIKIVILGQDPYHKRGQAMGLSFSVPFDVAKPPSLNNIYKELQRTHNINIPNHGNLEKWAKQGVFLLNSVLSVKEGKAGSCEHFGWQSFTDKVIQCISDIKSGVVFMLWGNFAKAKRNLIDTNKHYILEATHPSPLAGNRFIGCNCFKDADEILRKQNINPINWQV